MKEIKFETLRGKIIKNIILEYKNDDLKVLTLNFNLLKDKQYINKICEQNSLQSLGIEKLTLITETDKYIMKNERECCESVYLKEIEGDLSDIINYRIINAEEITTTYSSIDDSHTYTYYKIKTLKGDITFSWYGESNGYYTEQPYFYKETIIR